MIAHLHCDAVPHLLAVDVGLTFGWACYSHSNQLISYGSHHCTRRAKLKTLSWHLLRQLPPHSVVYAEGGGDLNSLWRRNAEKHGLAFRSLPAEQWRDECFYSRDRSRGAEAKRAAQRIAHTLVASQGKTSATPLRHDTAEAIVMGWWALRELEWLRLDHFKAQLGISR